MKSNLVKKFLFIGVVLLTGSCSLLTMKNKGDITSTQTGEKFIVNDAIPPLGYNPMYVNKTDTFRDTSSISYNLRVINTEIVAGKVKVTFNIFDNNGFVYFNADSTKKYQTWCNVQESIDTMSFPIKNYKISHDNQYDSLPFSFVFVLDHSGSMGSQRVLVVQNAIVNLVNYIKRSEDAVCVIKYDQKTVVETQLTKEKSTFLSQFRILGMSGYGGGTAINDGLSKAVDVLDKDTTMAKKIAIIFTDGGENSSSMSQGEVINKARSKGIKVFAIDFGDYCAGDYMKNIASQTGGCYYHMYGTDEFNYVFTDIYTRVKNTYTFEYTPGIFGLIHLKLGMCVGDTVFELNHDINYYPSEGNFILVNLNFDTNKSDIKKEFKTEIDRIVVLMNQYKNINIEIRGHTDDVGDDKSNMVLSQKRADAVKKELIRMGITENRLKSVGFGESMPIGDNNTPEGKYINRRTEFIIVK